MLHAKHKHFYGTATLGKKGQVVIPAAARSAIKAKKGEKLLVFGLGKDVVVLLKASNLESLASHLLRRVSMIQGIIKKSRKR
jgi:AbrB family looped-hinge helix DNA binding protein